MRVSTFWFDRKDGWSIETFPKVESDDAFLLLFCAPSLIDLDEPFNDLTSAFPNTIKIGCTGAGEIHDLEIHDDRLVVTLVQLESTLVRHVSVNISDLEDGYHAGRTISEKLLADDLKNIIVFSDGLLVNGSDLIQAFQDHLPEGVTVMGGMAGDGGDFERTVVISNETRSTGLVTAIGLYGEKITVSSGCKAGWDTFGHERIITKSNRNTVYEIDGVPALGLYKTYLGDKASELPGSGLFFPLSIRKKSGDDLYIVRAVQAVSEEDQSISFGGDVPEGYVAMMMYSNLDRIIDASGNVGSQAMAKQHGSTIKLGIAVSCVGRRVVLKDRADEEIEAVAQHLGDECQLVGFYSFGEIAPRANSICDLHNETMTLMVFSEAA